MKKKNFRTLIELIRLVSVVGEFLIIFSRVPLIIFQINVF